MVWPFTEWGGEDVHSGDLRNEPGHGPLFGWAPQATAEDLAAFAAQGSVCMCLACKRYRKGQ
jgi:hypothetical protein